MNIEQVRTKIRSKNIWLKEAQNKFYEVFWINVISDNPFYKSQIESIWRCIYKEEYLKNILKRKNLLKEETRNAVYFILWSTEIYWLILDKLRWLESAFNPGWFSSAYPWTMRYAYQYEEKNKEVYKVKHKVNDKEKKYKEEVKKIYDLITDKEIFTKLLIEEAEKYEKDFKNQIEYEKRNEWRKYLPEVAKKWALAWNIEKSKEYFNLCSNYEFPNAAKFFEKIWEKELSKEYWIKAAENPTWYKEDADYQSWQYFEKAWELKKAIDSYEKAISYWRWQDWGSFMNWDSKAWKCEANWLQKYVDELKKKILS